VAFEGGFVEDSWAIALINTKFRHCKCRDILVYNETWVKSIQIDTERSVRVLTSAKHNDPCENKLPERLSLYSSPILNRAKKMFQLDMQPLRSATKLDPCNIGILVYGIDIYIYIFCSQTYQLSPMISKHKWSGSSFQVE